MEGRYDHNNPVLSIIVSAGVNGLLEIASAANTW